MTFYQYVQRENARIITHLRDNLECGTALDHVTSGLRLDHNASLGGVAAAAATMDQEARATAHIIGGRRVQVIAVVHALEGSHVSESVGALRKWANAHLALAGRVVSATAGLPTAAPASVNVASIISSAIEMVPRLGIGVRPASGQVEAEQSLLLVSRRGTGSLVILEVEVRRHEE